MYDLIDFDTPIVQKYGGTSVANPELIHRVARRIARQKQAGWKTIAVVTSARVGVTNELVALIREVNLEGSRRL